MTLSDADIKRFEGKVYKTDHCWHWIANTNTGGYGSFNVRRDKNDAPGKSKMITRTAHRVSFFIHNGRQPNGILIHSCDIPGCVRPEHFSEGTNAENSADAKRKGRTAGVADWQPERHCKICKNAAWERWYKRSRGNDNATSRQR